MANTSIKKYNKNTKKQSYSKVFAKKFNVSQKKAKDFLQEQPGRHREELHWFRDWCVENYGFDFVYDRARGTYTRGRNEYYYVTKEFRKVRTAVSKLLDRHNFSLKRKNTVSDWDKLYLEKAYWDTRR